MQEINNWEELIERQPDRWLAFRNEVGEILEVHDTDTGTVWLLLEDGTWLPIQ